MKFKFKLGCQQANHICDKNQYKEAKFFEKLRLIIHLTYCKACQKYSSGNAKLTNLVQNPKVRMMRKSDKQNLKELLAVELNNQNKGK